MVALALAYPILVHLAVLWPEPWLEWLALAVLCALPLYRSMRAPRLWAWGTFAAAVSLCALAVAAGASPLLLRLPPIAIPLSLLFVFGSSLQRRAVPVVTRVATQMRGALPPELATYTRRVTQLWSVVFAALTLSALLLPLVASPEVWSLFTNFIHYLLIGAVFVAEYFYRRWRFRHLPHAGFWTYLRTIGPVRLRSP